MVLGAGCHGTLNEKGSTDDDDDAGPTTHDMHAAIDSSGGAAGTVACTPPSPLKGGTYAAVKAAMNLTHTTSTDPTTGCAGSICHNGNLGSTGPLALLLTGTDSSDYAALVHAASYYDVGGSSGTPMPATSVMDGELWRIVSGADVHVGGTFSVASEVTVFENWMLDCFPKP